MNSMAQAATAPPSPIDQSTAALMGRVADSIRENGVTPGQAAALRTVARGVIEAGDLDGAAQHVIDLIEPTAYVPPTECDVAERVTCAGEKGAILNAYLFTDECDGEPVGPTFLSVYSEPQSEGELDLAGTDKLIADLGALLPKLAAMRDVLAGEQDQAARLAGPLPSAAQHLAMAAVTQSLTGLTTNPTDVAKLLHRSIDNAQGWHLAEVGGHEEVVAYSNSRFGCAIDAMADALAASRDKGLTVRALRSALELVITEAGL
jgi:hypothetical protein